MSMNSKNTAFAIRNARSEEAFASGEYNLSDLDGCMEEARREAAYLESAAFTRYVSAEGLAQLAEAGANAFEASTGHELPHNLIRTEMSGSVGQVGPYGRRLSKAEADEEIEQYARFGGWLKAAAELPALRKAIKKTQSSRGVNSPRTTESLWRLFRKFPSPGGLERKLWAVKRRAEAILTAYEGGVCPSWQGIVAGLMVDARVGKAAVVAVATTLSGLSHFRTYREAREWLVQLHTYSVADASDGVEARRKAEPVLAKLGVEVFDLIVKDRFHHWGDDTQWLVRSANGRTYHSSTWEGPLEAMREAIHAWKQQDALAAENADLVDFLRGEEGFCPLVVRQDSFAAGNCSSGTEAWLQENGWAGREFIPAAWLVPHLEHGLVKNVATALYRRHETTQLAA